MVAPQKYVEVIFQLLWSRNPNNALVPWWCTNLTIYEPILTTFKFFRSRYLFKNELSGEIPSSIGKLTSLQSLWVFFRFFFPNAIKWVIIVCWKRVWNCKYALTILFYSYQILFQQIKNQSRWWSCTTMIIMMLL